MKKKNVHIDELQVNSFVTAIPSDQVNALKGGANNNDTDDQKCKPDPDDDGGSGDPGCPTCGPKKK